MEREISPFLGLTEAEEHEILGSAPHSVLEQKIAMLRLWKKKELLPLITNCVGRLESLRNLILRTR